MTPDAPFVETASSHELACTSCRNRKLKCDRIKPACTRCTRVNNDCVYPESRRKPAFKRRNVRELEARLAQVEDLLKKAGGQPLAQESPDEVVEFNFADFNPATEDVFLQGMDYSIPDHLGDGSMFSAPHVDASSYDQAGPTNYSQPSGETFSGELIGLGLSEQLPPLEVMEDLNKVYFARQQMFIPILHPARYLQAFYSAPQLKPPMCLQYAIWSLASNGDGKYGHLHDIFYSRARQYAEADELKGYGEHFITVQHAQAWCLIATDEAKSMWFTRAAMSAAKAVRLVQMLGLHRLDCPPEDISPTLLPPRDWIELEERRRTFWSAFCIDSHTAISTGWPHLIDGSDVTTHLPAPETAFASGQAVEGCRLNQAFQGHSYSSFGSAILICHIFNQILMHIHRPKPTDDPGNYEFGGFWQRHRDIDNTLSSAFMFLPEPFRLPENYRDPTAVHTNLNLHASLICLHLAALEKIDQYNHADYAKKASEGRLFTAAHEIVNIVKLTSHLKSAPRSPMAAISLYCAATAYIYQCKETQSAKNVDNLDFIIAAMDAIGREHAITRAFLKQVVLDIERNNITQIVRLPRLDNLPPIVDVSNHNIPLFARSKISRHSAMQPPLPGRLPLGRPVGNIGRNKMKDCGIGFNYGIQDNSLPHNADGTQGDNNSIPFNSTDSEMHRVSEVNDGPPWQTHTTNLPSSSNTHTGSGITATTQKQQTQGHSLPQDHAILSASTASSSSSSFIPQQSQPPSNPTVLDTWMRLDSQGRFTSACELPHRTNSPATTTPGGSSIHTVASGGTGPPVSAPVLGPSAAPTTQSGVTLSGTVFPRGELGFGYQAHNQARIADRGLGPNGLDTWDRVGQSMYTQFMHAPPEEKAGAEVEAQQQQQQKQKQPAHTTEEFASDPLWSTSASQDQQHQSHIDWEALAAAAGIGSAGIGVPGTTTTSTMNAPPPGPGRSGSSRNLGSGGATG